MKRTQNVLLAGLGVLAAAHFTTSAFAEDSYKVVNSSQTMGAGGIDYVCADSEGRRIYVPRGNQILAFDLDTLKQVGSITNSGGHGVAVDPKSHHAFSSHNPVTMFDTTTLETIKTIKVEGNPDGIMYEPGTEKIWILSHQEPNVTVIEPKDGSITGTFSIGGAPEQGASDGMGKVYIDLEDENQIAVVDAKAMKATGHYTLGDKAKAPAGLALDAKNHILFAMCREPAMCVILNADDGKVITALPIGTGTDGAGFNPNTMEAFSSQRDGTLSIIKETSPTTFEVSQTVQTKQGAKTCSLDTKKNQIVLIATEAAPASATTPATPPPTDQPAGARRPRGNRGGPGFLDILVVGK